MIQKEEVLNCNILVNQYYSSMGPLCKKEKKTYFEALCEILQYNIYGVIYSRSQYLQIKKKYK